MNEELSKKIRYVFLIFFAVFLGISFSVSYKPGTEIGINFYHFSLNMIKIFPSAFILIGLFEVWVKKETVEKYLGKDSGLKAHFWAILLAGTTVGGSFISFPIAYSLHKKGARLSIIITYIEASCIVRIPMTIFEASFLGIKFSLIRLMVSIPLVIISSILIERFFNIKIKEKENL